MRIRKPKIKSNKVTNDAYIETGNESTTDDNIQLQKVHRVNNNEHRARKLENVNQDGMKSHQLRSKKGINWSHKLFRKSKPGREGLFG